MPTHVHDHFEHTFVVKVRSLRLLTKAEFVDLIQSSFEVLDCSLQDADQVAKNIVSGKLERLQVYPVQKSRLQLSKHAFVGEDSHQDEIDDANNDHGERHDVLTLVESALMGLCEVPDVVRKHREAIGAQPVDEERLFEKVKEEFVKWLVGQFKAGRS